MFFFRPEFSVLHYSFAPKLILYWKRSQMKYNVAILFNTVLTQEYKLWNKWRKMASSLRFTSKYIPAVYL